MRERFRKQMEKSKTTTNKMLFAEHMKDFQQKLITSIVLIKSLLCIDCFFCYDKLCPN